MEFSCKLFSSKIKEIKIYKNIFPLFHQKPLADER